MYVQELCTAVEKVSIIVSRCRGSYMNPRKARPGVNALSSGKSHWCQVWIRINSNCHFFDVFYIVLDKK